MRDIAKSAARGLLQASGLTAGIRYWNRNGVRIIMYHRFPAQSELEAQCEHLKKHYRPLSLTEVSASLTRRKPPLRGPPLITGEAGYPDLLGNACPILKTSPFPCLASLAPDLPT